MSDSLSITRLSTIPTLVWAGIILQTTLCSECVINLTTAPTYNAYSNQLPTVAIYYLDSDKYHLRRPIIVSIANDGDEYLASFDDAELSLSGSTEKEAIEWLQSSIITLYDLLKSRPADSLGPVPTRQLSVLERYLEEVPIQKDEALKIARKLSAKIDKHGAHQVASFEYDGKLIFTFGIRHGKDGGHGHLVGSNRVLRLNETKIIEFVSCSLTFEQYVEHLKKLGVIPI